VRLLTREAHHEAVRVVVELPLEAIVARIASREYLRRRLRVFLANYRVLRIPDRPSRTPSRRDMREHGAHAGSLLSHVVVVELPGVRASRPRQKVSKPYLLRGFSVRDRPCVTRPCKDIKIGPRRSASRCERRPCTTVPPAKPAGSFDIKLIRYTLNLVVG